MSDGNLHREIKSTPLIKMYVLDTNSYIHFGCPLDSFKDMSLRSGIEGLTSSLGSGLAPVWKLYQRQIKSTASYATKIKSISKWNQTAKRRTLILMLFIF